MANEKRFIDATALIKKWISERDFLLNRWGGYGALLNREKGRVDELNDCIGDAENAPTVDAVEVVRCRDCKYFSRDAEYNRAWCNFYTGCIETAVNGYCYHGAKMDGGNEDV